MDTSVRGYRIYADGDGDDPTGYSYYVFVVFYHIYPPSSAVLEVIPVEYP